MENRKSYILKITDNMSGQVFICNRNDDSFGNTLYKDRYVKWFGFDSYDLMHFDDMNNCVQVLETINVSNYNRNDQKLLNERKQHFIDTFNSNEEDYVLCNKQLTDHCMTIRRIVYAKYNMMLDKLDAMEPYDIWSKLKEIWNLHNRGYYISKSNYEILDMNLSDEGKAVLMFYNKYLQGRLKNGCKYIVDKDVFSRFYKNIRRHANTVK